MGKAWLQDAYTQSELTLAAVRLATDFLAPGGTFVTKIFRSSDYNSLMFVMNQLFRKVAATKPTASRSESAEIYVMATGFRAPKTIDPRLLNPKYVFKDLGAGGLDAIAAEAAAGGEIVKAKRDLVLTTVLKEQRKRKRHREGYADGALTLFTRVPATDFFRTLRPVAMVCDVNELTLDSKYLPKVKAAMSDAGSNLKFGEEKKESVVDEVEARSRDVLALDLVARLPETTAEVLACCKDLKVLGRKEFKLLLKWRDSARSALAEEGLLEDGDRNGEDGEEGEGEKVSDVEKETDEFGNVMETEADLDDELADARTEMEAKDKRKKRKSNKLRSALQRKIDMKIVLPNDQIEVDDQNAAGLFKLSTAMRAQSHGAQLSLAVDAAMEADDESSESEGDVARIARVAAENADRRYRLKDAEEAQEENEKNIGDELDHWYKVYLARTKKDKNGALLQESKDRKRRTKRRALREAQEAAANEDESRKRRGGDDCIGSGNSADDRLLDVDSSASSLSGESSNNSDLDSDGDVDLGKLPVNSREAALWFSNPVFDGVVLSSDDESSLTGSDRGDHSKRARAGGRFVRGDGAGFVDESDFLSAKERKRLEDGGGEDIHGAAMREARKMASDLAKERQEDGFEVAPAEKPADSDDDDGDTDNHSAKGSASGSDGAASDSSFHSSDYDTDEKAEMVAIGRRMRQSNKEATEVLDDAYNRYTFDDPLDLPRWFADPDPIYRQRRSAIVTKEQVAEMKAYIKSIDAQPSKKEAEAKARKRQRTAKKAEVMKTKANAIAEQKDVPAASRMRAIETLYKQASKSTKIKKQRKKQYVAVQPGGGKKVVGGVKNSNYKGRKAKGSLYTVTVDKRMKTDKRGMAKAARSKKK